MEATAPEQLEIVSKQSLTTATEVSTAAKPKVSNISRKLSFGKQVVGTSSPWKSRQIQRSLSAQFKLDMDDTGSTSAISRASSASLGFSLSFNGYTPTPEDITMDRKVFTNAEDDDDDIQMNTDVSKRRWILPESTMPIYLKFTDVKYKVTIKGVTTNREKEILNGITGSASPGEVLAFMGPSGSGKTTMLNLLGGRMGNSNADGSITYNDASYSKSLKRRIGFVTQDDVLYVHLTVKETLTYAALLRLPKTMTRRQKEERVMDVIYELGLERCQDSMIGGPFVRGVSGGERKRVCIGNDIIINPSLLFLDEPTSGLDSTTALKTVQLLHNIAEAGKTVVTTIHQPSSRMFHKFTRLILLAKGRLLYFGRASEVMGYFSSIGFSPLITMNPAEFLLDLANGNINDVSVSLQLDDKVQKKVRNSETQNVKLSTNDVHEYLVEAYETQVSHTIKRELLVPIPVKQDLKENLSSSKREWAASWWEQYSILFCRGLKERRHDYMSWMRVIQVLATAIILGLLWWRSDCTTPKDLQDQAGLLFFIAVFWSFFPVYTAIFTFPQERAMMNKERAVDMYRLSAYFMARTTSDLPLDLVLPVIFITIVYFMAGLRLGAAPFFLSILTVFLNVVAAQGLGLTIGAAVMDIKKASTLASVTVMAFMLTGGFFVQKVPAFISWTRYISFNYHTYRLLLKVQYGHVPDYINNSHNNIGVTEVIAMIAMIFGYRMLAYLSLRMKLPNQS